MKFIRLGSVGGLIYIPSRFCIWKSRAERVLGKGMVWVWGYLKSGHDYSQSTLCFLLRWLAGGWGKIVSAMAKESVSGSLGCGVNTDKNCRPFHNIGGRVGRVGYLKTLGGQPDYLPFAAAGADAASAEAGVATAAGAASVCCLRPPPRAL